jgi:enoyl-CoA hydratase
MVDLTWRAFGISSASRRPAPNRIESIEKPVIGAIHGYAGGLGLEIALSCDARIVAKGTRLGMPEVRVGLVPDVGGTTRLARTVGYARAKELIMTARLVDADEAERIGLVNRMVAPRAAISWLPKNSRARWHLTPRWRWASPNESSTAATVWTK